MIIFTLQILVTLYLFLDAIGKVKEALDARQMQNYSAAITSLSGLLLTATILFLIWRP